MELWTGFISFINTITNWMYPWKLEYPLKFFLYLWYQFMEFLFFSPKKFEEGVLEICFHLLRRSHGNTVNGAKMSDPIQISRTITKIVSIATVEVNLFQDLSP